VVLVSLDRALGRLPGDRATEHLVREIIQMLRVRPGEPMSAADVARRLERPASSVAVVLLELADAYVLRRDGLSYSYERDLALELDVDRFMTRAESHSAMSQANIAKFRDRFDYR
jgi:DNA-binding IclR family transcriptional regulator